MVTVSWHSEGMGSGKPMTIRVEPAVRADLTDVVEEQKDCRLAWEALGRWDTKGLSAKSRAARRGQWRTFLAGLRRSGLILDTIDRVAEVGVAAALAHRGWDHQWPRVPEAGRFKGRWPGAVDQNGEYRASVPFVLSEGLARRVHAACWHTSAPAIKALWEWNTEAAIVRRREENIDSGVEYQRLVAEVTTVGDIGRAGLELGIEQARSALRHAWGLVAAEQFYEREGHLRVPRGHAEEVLSSSAPKGIRCVRLFTGIRDWRNESQAGTLDSHVRDHLDRLGLGWESGRKGRTARS
jgi:hypothetical protein